jgi:hypothetical protein
VVINPLVPLPLVVINPLVPLPLVVINPLVPLPLVVINPLAPLPLVVINPLAPLPLAVVTNHPLAPPQEVPHLQEHRLLPHLYALLRPPTATRAVGRSLQVFLSLPHHLSRIAMNSVAMESLKAERNAIMVRSMACSIQSVASRVKTR